MTDKLTLTDGVNTVTLEATKVAEDEQNDLQEILIPRTKQTRASGPKVKGGNFLKIRTTFTIDCLLDSTSTATARAQKATLKSINRSGLLVTLSYEGRSITGYIRKVSNVHVPTDEDEPSNYDIIIQFQEFTESLF